MMVAYFAAGIVDLEPRARSDPDSGYARMIQCGAEFIKARLDLAPERHQRIHSAVNDSGRLKQAAVLQ
jgi:hypothetical protein